MIRQHKNKLMIVMKNYKLCIKALVKKELKEKVDKSQLEALLAIADKITNDI